ncbi:type VI secretion system lipoprotein TssJ [Psychromonas sp. Urea-02u-13]|uniref:type VI secretion system lipoprotein TssJ n=1 Tax=Psychromonas sp. Urea-02u-13 TaxID=2058326 RepID=UPI000C3272FB|nr:type VI secretion system lipoprotein TssJ [Psychromonas sp. Urea-02u-13]PKG38773.1 type VI secretion system lipoprotein TssJ [Psychromonas sp. Urea-02u-13]
MNNFNLSKFFYAVIAMLLLTSCSAMNTKVGGVLDLDTDFQLSFIVEDNINPDDSKVPSPVIVRMYELKSTKLFEKANFIDLYERDAEVLGKSMIAQQALKAIKPGEERTENFVLSKDTQYIGLYVEFLQFENAKYKVTIPIAQTNIISSSAKVQLLDNTISILK